MGSRAYEALESVLPTPSQHLDLSPLKTYILNYSRSKKVDELLTRKIYQISGESQDLEQGLYEFTVYLIQRLNVNPISIKPNFRNNKLVEIIEGFKTK